MLSGLRATGTIVKRSSKVDGNMCLYFSDVTTQYGTRTVSELANLKVYTILFYTI